MHIGLWFTKWYINYLLWVVGIQQNWIFLNYLFINLPPVPNCSNVINRSLNDYIITLVMLIESIIVVCLSFLNYPEFFRRCVGKSLLQLINENSVSFREFFHLFSIVSSIMFWVVLLMTLLSFWNLHSFLSGI